MSDSNPPSPVLPPQPAPRTEMQVLGSQLTHLFGDMNRATQSSMRQMQEQNQAFVQQLQRNAQGATLSFTEKDPKFLTWDGNISSLLFWLHQVEQIKEARNFQMIILSGLPAWPCGQQHTGTLTGYASTIGPNSGTSSVLGFFQLTSSSSSLRSWSNTI